MGYFVDAGYHVAWIIRSVDGRVGIEPERLNEFDLMMLVLGFRLRECKIEEGPRI